MIFFSSSVVFCYLRSAAACEGNTCSTAPRGKPRVLNWAWESSNNVSHTHTHTRTSSKKHTRSQIFSVSLLQGRLGKTWRTKSHTPFPSVSDVLHFYCRQKASSKETIVTHTYSHLNTQTTKKRPCHLSICVRKVRRFCLCFSRFRSLLLSNIAGFIQCV